MSEKQLRISIAAAIVAVVVGYYVYSSLQGGTLRARLADGRSVSFVGRDFGIPYSRFTGVETLRKIQSKELIAEVEKVIEQNGLPADVFYGLSAGVPGEERTNTKEYRQKQLEYDNEKQKMQEYNIAVTLYEQFLAYDAPEPSDEQKSLKENLEKLWEASPVGDWDADKQKLDSVAAILAKMQSKRHIIRDRLREPRIHFYYIFDRPDSLRSFSRTGTVVDTWASKYVADYALLEEYAIAQALLDGNIKEAMDALAYIFRIAQSASALSNVGVRTDAALVRLRAFDVMQRVVLDPKFERRHMIDLREMLSEQREHWTSECVAWFGDRASGMKLYHRIRTDGPLNALEPATLEALERDEMMGKFIQGFGKNHEADLVFYLRSMQKIFDVSKKPFYQRLDTLNQLNGELRPVATEYVVANLMLKDVQELMGIFAQDQSALERAFVATLRSLGQSNTDNYLDPLTGKTYEVRRVQGLFSVSSEVLPHPFRVPIFTDRE